MQVEDAGERRIKAGRKSRERLVICDEFISAHMARFTDDDVWAERRRSH